MPFEPWLYILLIALSIGHILCQLYFVISFSDLEADYINPMELCETMDTMLPWEALVQAVETGIMLVFGKWLGFFFYLPLASYNAFQYSQTRLKFDATTIFKTVRDHRIVSMIKLGYYFIGFCIFLYLMISSLIKWSDSIY